MASVHKLPDSNTHNGVYGDPRRANPEKGRAYFEACVTKVSEVVNNFNPKHFGLEQGS
jgi:creatinine amidohydrolase/Fe(II)-dependent formamide hydrolase-like protein